MHSPFPGMDPYLEVPDIWRDLHLTLIVNLRGCLDRAYQEARYDNDVNYARPHHPPLAGPDATWARNLLKKTR